MARRGRERNLAASSQAHNTILAEVKDILKSFETDLLLPSSISVELASRENNGQKRRRMENLDSDGRQQGPPTYYGVGKRTSIKFCHNFLRRN